jgi:hypothetical protein
MKNKCEIFTHFQMFTNLVDITKKIKTFRTDNETEFINHNFSNFINLNDIIYQITCVYTPQ